MYISTCASLHVMYLSLVCLTMCSSRWLTSLTLSSSPGGVLLLTWAIFSWAADSCSCWNACTVKQHNRNKVLLFIKHKEPCSHLLWAINSVLTVYSTVSYLSCQFIKLLHPCHMIHNYMYMTLYIQSPLDVLLCTYMYTHACTVT